VLADARKDGQHDDDKSLFNANPFLKPGIIHCGKSWLSIQTNSFWKIFGSASSVGSG
jgi:hypothetical protein